jgi:hypothetical protein
MTAWSSVFRRAAQRGSTAVEFAMTSLIFFTFILGIFEGARAMYLWSTMAEVTRRAARAAAVTDFSCASAMDLLSKHALFRTTSGGVPMGGAIDETYLDITYLKSDASTPVSPMPADPAQNLINCTINPNGDSCIRFVQVRLCAPGSSCSRVSYTPMVGLDHLFPAMNFPTFAAITPVTSLGRKPGVADICP